MTREGKKGPAWATVSSRGGRCDALASLSDMRLALERPDDMPSGASV